MKAHNLQVTGSLLSGGEAIGSISSSVATTTLGLGSRITTIEGKSLVSGSGQIPSLLPSGVVSGSAQTIANLPSGVVSGSAQTVANLPSGTVSGSVQVDIMSTTNIARLATTGSNTFQGSQTVNGSLVVTGSLTAQQFIVSSSVTYLTESFASGSHKFGDSSDDYHDFTGSVRITGSINVTGSLLTTGSSVGIGGQANPARTLHVMGQGAFDMTHAGVVIQDSISPMTSSQIVSYKQTNAVGSAYRNMHLRADVLGVAIMSGSGYVSIGKDTANSMLDVNGNTLVSGSLTTTGDLTVNSNGAIFNRTSSGEPYLFFRKDGVNRGSIYGITGGGLRMFDQSDNQVFTMTGSMIGIGYSDPQYTLQVNGSIGLRANSQNIKAITGTGWGYSVSTYKVVMIGDTANNVTVSIGYDPSGNSNSAFSGGGSEVLFRNGASFATPTSANTAFHLNTLVLKDGNVLFGTSNADVGGSVLGAVIRSNGTMAAAINMASPANYTSPIAADRMNTAGDGVMYGMWRAGIFQCGIGATSGQLMTFVTGDGSNNVQTERMRIAGSNIGIGVTSPASKLHVGGNIKYSGRIFSSAAIVGNIYSNLTGAAAPSYILLYDLNETAGWTLVGHCNAASWTCWNISQIWIQKNYSSTASSAGITGLYKSGCNMTIVDLSYGGGRYIAIGYTSNPEIDVVWTGYNLTNQFTSDGQATVVAGASVTVNATLATY